MAVEYWIFQTVYSKIQIILRDSDWILRSFRESAEKLCTLNTDISRLETHILKLMKGNSIPSVMSTVPFVQTNSYRKVRDLL